MEVFSCHFLLEEVCSAEMVAVDTQSEVGGTAPDTACSQLEDIFCSLTT